jgi:glyoxylase-like metal-dependent hydrolase (beta-lactamase superfamily II)
VKRLADGLYQLSGFPPNGINVYLIGDVIVDAATRHASRRILRQVRGHDVTAHALTHAHPDHQGASKAICDALDRRHRLGAARPLARQHHRPSVVRAATQGRPRAA